VISVVIAVQDIVIVTASLFKRRDTFLVELKLVMRKKGNCKLKHLMF